MSVQIRGGLPIIRRANAVNTTGREVDPPGAINFLQISNDGANAVRVYFTKEDFDADAGLASTEGWIVLAATSGFFEGPVELEPANKLQRFDRIWLRAVAGTTDVAVLFYFRRG